MIKIKCVDCENVVEVKSLKAFLKTSRNFDCQNCGSPNFISSENFARNCPQCGNKDIVFANEKTKSKCSKCRFNVWELKAIKVTNTLEVTEPDKKKTPEKKKNKASDSAKKTSRRNK